MKMVNLLFLGSLSYYTSVTSQRKQHVHWGCLGEKCVFSNKPNIYTPHLHFFPPCPVETLLMMTGPCVWAVGTLHTRTHCIPREIFHLKVITIVSRRWWNFFKRDHNRGASQEVSPCPIYLFWGTRTWAVLLFSSNDERNLSSLRAVRDLWWL